jgi:addiction module RelE/StbE family toxin
MKVRFTEPAAADLEEIYNYLYERNPPAAERVKNRIRADAEKLGQNPYMARSTEAPGIRVLTVASYLVFYRIRDGEVHIIRIRHGARRPWTPDSE